MLKEIAVVVILFSTFLNALMDSIDHMKRSEGVFELWHILKWLSYTIPYTFIAIITGLTVVQAVLIYILMCILWEVVYRIGIYKELWKYDNVWVNKIIELIWRFHR